MEHFLLNLVPLMSGVILGISYIPQLITTYRTKNVDGIDKRFWILITTALFGLTVSTGAVWYYKGTWGNFAVELVNVTLAVTMLILVMKYRRKKPHIEDEAMVEK